MSIKIPQSTIPRLTQSADLVWKTLNGVFIIYKPERTKISATIYSIKKNICEELNQMEVRPMNQYVSLQGPTNKPMRVVVHPDWGDHPLVVGPRYQPMDIKLKLVNKLEDNTSGVLVFGINEGINWVKRLRKSKFTSYYKVKGTLGYSTDNFYKSGRIVERSKCAHVQRSTIDKLCAAMQAAHQRKMFEASGFDLQSQATYELATQGLVRPANNELPILYMIKCIHFNMPEFILEIVCINEYEQYLMALVHEIGLKLHTNATCTQIQCFKYGIFDIKDALLSKHWTLQNILNSINECEELLLKNETMFHATSPVLVEGKE